MKPFTIFCLLILFCLSACKNEQIDELNIQRPTACLSNTESEYPEKRDIGPFCNTDNCIQYLNIWKEIIQEKNNFSQGYFDTHIELYNTSIRNWSQGTSFNVCYTIQIDWAVTYVCDKFIINIDPDNTYYPALDLPRDVDLSKEEIELVIESSAFNSKISKIYMVTDPFHLDFEAAMNDIIEFSGVDELCFIRTELDRDSGNIILEVMAEYFNEENSCIRGSIDLITGEKEANDTPCYI